MRQTPIVKASKSTHLVAWGVSNLGKDAPHRYSLRLRMKKQREKKSFPKYYATGVWDIPHAVPRIHRCDRTGNESTETESVPTAEELIFRPALQVKMARNVAFRRTSRNYHAFCSCKRKPVPRSEEYWDNGRVFAANSLS